MNKNYAIQGFILSSLLSLAGCASMQVNHSNTVAIPDNRVVVVFPLSNLTETPQADDRATAITADLLRMKGFTKVVVYHPKSQQPSLIPGVKAPISRQALMAFARTQGASYALTGSVSEWNYKVGLDGEPVVGINLELIDVETGKHLWSAIGSESGGSRTAVSEVAIHLVNTLLNTLQSKSVYAAG